MLKPKGPLFRPGYVIMVLISLELFMIVNGLAPAY